MFTSKSIFAFVSLSASALSSPTLSGLLGLNTQADLGVTSTFCAGLDVSALSTRVIQQACAAAGLAVGTKVLSGPNCGTNLGTSGAASSGINLLGISLGASASANTVASTQANVGTNAGSNGSTGPTAGTNAGTIIGSTAPANTGVVGPTGVTNSGTIVVPTGVANAGTTVGPTGAANTGTIVVPTGAANSGTTAGPTGVANSGTIVGSTGTVNSGTPIGSNGAIQTGTNVSPAPVTPGSLTDNYKNSFLNILGGCNSLSGQLNQILAGTGHLAASTVSTLSQDVIIPTLNNVATKLNGLIAATQDVKQCADGASQAAVYRSYVELATTLQSVFSTMASLQSDLYAKVEVKAAVHASLIQLQSSLKVAQSAFRLCFVGP